MTYANCGDRVDSCTAIVEHLDGRLELVHRGSVCTPSMPLSPRI
ncbi:hypothetical protein [uncultured Propionivibrio sp.]